MKKIGFLLLVCVMAVYSACDDKGKEKDPVPVNPVTEYKVPETGGIGKDVTVAGKGFPKESKIFLKDAGAALKEATVKTVTAVDLVFTVPGDIKTGEYTVLLKIGEAEYELGKIKLEPAVPVTGYEVPAEATVGDKVLIKGKGFADDCKISLKPETGDPLVIETVEQVETGIQFTLPEDLTPGDYKVELIQEGEWELGMLKVKGVIPRVRKITCDNEDTYTYAFEYYEDGKIKTIVKEGGGNYKKWIIKYESSKIEVTYQDKDGNIVADRSDIYHLNEEGVVTSSESQAEGGNENYTYQYNAGFLTRVEPGINFKYESDNLKVAWYDGRVEGDYEGYFSFTYGSQKYDALNLDPFTFILDDYLGFSDQNIRMLGIGGKRSVNLPIGLDGWATTYTIGYTFTEGEPQMIRSIKLTDDTEPEYYGEYTFEY